MRCAVFVLPLLLLGGCSCQRHSNDDGAAADDQAAAAAVAAAPAGSVAQGLAGSSAPPSSAVASGAADEPTVVRQYFNTLMTGDRAAADAFWSGSRTSARPDDIALRELPGLLGLRMETDPPIARDDAQPSRLREVPVRIRARTAEGTLRYHGWYRLQPRADGSGWEIHGASLQPTLD
ncbi:hypothetical protein [Stenotrophomonas rhizophila]|uniref:hypothetical protein n=1 Tax=Stenotrophomonas rhizophila TaxID=216778 RepID=UPI001E4E0F16|nr:hypothetical protein [Stenotrophomonas rhizophila]MCC7634574.1 hypothetical protein [Stenotrophomonas rhizophila]MCC7664157.1 hypothetical protein [Stenotrophomonas rhizophila]